MLDLPAADLLAVAEAEVKRIQGEMDRIAAKLAPGQSLRQAISLGSAYHPERSQLESAYRATLASAKQFLVQRSLLDAGNLPLPEVQLTPEWIRSLGSRFPGVVRLNGFQPQVGAPTFFLAFGPTISDAQMQLELSRHDYGTLTWLALHDVYPGEYVRRAAAARSRVRTLFGSRTGAEGWDDYAASLMQEAGYLPPALAKTTDEPDRLRFQFSLLRQQLLRASLMSTALASQIKDLDVRPGTLYFEDRAYLGIGVDQFLNYIMDDPLCFADTLGRLQIQKLKADYRKAQGANYSERKFNDTVLQYMGVPIPLIRKALLGDNSGAAL